MVTFFSQEWLDTLSAKLRENDNYQEKPRDLTALFNSLLNPALKRE